MASEIAELVVRWVLTFGLLSLGVHCSLAQSPSEADGAAASSADGAAAKPDGASQPAGGADQPQNGQAVPGRQGDQATGPQGELVRLAKDYNLWMDQQRQQVIFDGRVSLREGALEMFACPAGTKEHESIVAVDCPPSYVHAALLAIGLKPGKPARFEPEYEPAVGPKVEIWVLWIDKEGRRRSARAQQWVKDTRTGEPMEFDWVFAGSGFWEDEATGQQHYMADGGDFICVSNFTTATLDLTIESSALTGGLRFEALTESIPNVGTDVRLVLAAAPPAAAEAAAAESSTP